MDDCVFDVLDQQHAAPTNAAADASLTCPAGARGFYISVATNDVMLSLDGTTATATNGLRIKAAEQALYIPIPRDLSVIGTAAGASDVTVVWVR